MLINIVEYFEKHLEKQATFIFFDAQKAFDNVYWPSILEQLKYTAGEAEFVGMMETIYMEQKGRILVNGNLTGNIEISKGTRQGCSLSLLLFIFSMGVLNNYIKKEKVKGLKFRKQEYKLLVFADDLAVILEDLLDSFEQLKEKIEKYGEAAGMRMNLEKTKMLTKNLDPTHMETLQEKTGIKMEKIFRNCIFK